MKTGKPAFLHVLRACALVCLPACPFASFACWGGTDQAGPSHAFARGRSARFLLVRCRGHAQIPLRHENSLDVDLKKHTLTEAHDRSSSSPPPRPPNETPTTPPPRGLNESLVRKKKEIFCLPVERWIGSGAPRGRVKEVDFLRPKRAGSDKHTSHTHVDDLPTRLLPCCRLPAADCASAATVARAVCLLTSICSLHMRCSRYAPMSDSPTGSRSHTCPNRAGAV